MVDFIAEARRQQYLERLYERSGRSCGTYTGLFIQRQQQLIEDDMTRELGDGDDPSIKSTPPTDG